MSVKPPFADGESYRRSVLSAQGAASVAYYFTPVLGVQDDVIVGYSILENDYAVDAKGQFEGALHAFLSDRETYLIGGFAQVGWDGHYDNIGTEYGGLYIELLSHYLGVEGKLFGDLSSFYGQIGWTSITPRGDTKPFASGPFATLEYRHFLTPDMMVEGHGGVVGLKRDSYGSGHMAVNLGLGAEFRLPETPLSVFASYDYYNARGGSFYDSHRVLAGIRLNHGSGSLWGQETSGTSLSPSSICRSFRRLSLRRLRHRSPPPSRLDGLRLLAQKRGRAGVAQW